MDEPDMIQKHLSKKGYEKAVKEALIEMAKESKSRNSSKKNASKLVNIIGEKKILGSVRRSPRFVNVVPASNATSEQEMQTVRRSPRFAIERESKKDKQHKVQNTVRRSERVRQKQSM